MLVASGKCQKIYEKRELCLKYGKYYPLVNGY